MADEAGPSGAAQPQTEEAINESNQKFEQGIQAIKDSDYEKAVAMFADVLNVRALHYGQLAPECADVYYRYGSALLYQAQESADVFGGPMRAAQGDGDKENEEAAEEEAPPAPASATAAPTGAGDDKGKAPAVPADEETTAEDLGAVGEGPEGGANASGEEDFEGGDLQLAWENLETARAIWAKHPEKYLKQLADVHSQLADVNMENEAFEDALSDIDAALNYHKEAGVGDADRRTAELQFRRSLVLQFLGRPSEALESVKAAAATLERRKESMAAVAEAAEKDEAEKKAAAEEVADLVAFLEELKDKVEELEEVIKEDEATRDMLRNTMASFTAAAQGGAGGEASKPPGPSPVKDLGVVGRGTKRINLAPVSTAPAGGAEGANGSSQPAAKKRALEDLMGGGPGGDTSFGFGSAPASAAAAGGEAGKEAEKKEETAAATAIPAFLQAASLAKVYTPGEDKQ